MPREPRPAAAPPDEAALREAALAHLARFAATEAALRRVLQRRVDRWARAAEQGGEPRETVAVRAAEAKRLAGQVARTLAAAGAVDDAAFAASRATRLARAGRSRRGIAAHLAAKGVGRMTAEAALPEDELGAAVAYCRRRRLGPFGTGAASREARLKAMGSLARAGFARAVAEAALDMDPEAAEARLIALRGG